MWKLLLILFLLIPNSFAIEDSLLNCDKFSGSWWNPFDWFNDAEQDMYNYCQQILDDSSLTIPQKKLKVLNLYNKDPNVFDFDFVRLWNKDLEIDLSENVEGVQKHNSTLIKDAFFEFTILDPSVILEDQKNTMVIPYNSTLHVDYNYTVDLPLYEEAKKWPDFTFKGFCKEEYSLVSDKGTFDLFIDKNKRIGSDLEKNISLNLLEQGQHTLDGLYTIEVSIKGVYHQWRQFCADWGEHGCIEFDYVCDEFYKDEIIMDQVIITDYKNISIEQPQMNFSYLNITGLNEDITVDVGFDGLDKLQRFNFNDWYVISNYLAKLVYFYSPINYIQLLAINNPEPLYNSSFVQKKGESFVFQSYPGLKNISLDYNGFFFNGSITTELKYKNFTYPDLYFDGFWFKPGDEVKVYPYIFREKNRCEDCSVVVDKVRLSYDDQVVYVDSNAIEKKSSKSFIYKEGLDCIMVYYEGDENHYASSKCVEIPQEELIFTQLKWYYFAFVAASIIAFALRKYTMYKEVDE